MQPPAGPFLPRRRAVLAAGALLPVGRFLPALPDTHRGEVVGVARYRFLSEHQAAVLTEATARLVPGPHDDPAETGHPGAREAGVTRYIDRLLSAFEVNPPHVFAGAPWSNRHAPGPDRMAEFVPLHERQERAWRRRVARLQHEVAAAVVALDRAAAADGYPDFVAAPAVVQDRLLTELDQVRDLLFGMTVDAMYSVPEYGGNAGLTAWQEIGWPGDIEPVGYSPAAVEGDDGLDPIAADDLPAVREALAALPALGRGRRRRSSSRG